MRLFVAACLTVAVSLAALPGAQAELVPQLQVSQPAVPLAAEQSYCTCDPIPIIIVIVVVAGLLLCASDAAVYDLAHAYDPDQGDALDPERNDCAIDPAPPYACPVGETYDQMVAAAFVHATVRTCGLPLPFP